MKKSIIKIETIHKNKWEEIPKVMCTYYFMVNDKIMYIGHAQDLRQRLRKHFNDPFLQNHINYDTITHIVYGVDYYEEDLLIDKYKPQWNLRSNPAAPFFIKECLCEDCRKWHATDFQCEESKNAWMRIYD